MRNWVRGARILMVSLILLPGACAECRADYFPKAQFATYNARGRFPFWSSTWVPLERRIFLDKEGVPYVEYQNGKSYNATTISLFGLLAYNRFLDHGGQRDRNQFLQMAEWLSGHQNERNGCWCHDFDLTHNALAETLHQPWISAMSQGLAMSVLTRAYALTEKPQYLRVAERGLLPFLVPVEKGGVTRRFSVAPTGAGSADAPFFEEYPTQPDPSFTLNGFMFALLGLYDLSQIPNQQAATLFESGMQTLHTALPLFDLGDGSAYDLVHLTRPPRPVHRDLGYHLVHISELNALGTALNDANLLWYRDHWNSYGTPADAGFVWLEHFGIWLLFRQRLLLVLLAIAGLGLGLFALKSVRAILRRPAAHDLLRPSNTAVAQS